MNEQEARLILQAYRPGAGPDDPEVAAALQEVAGTSSGPEPGTPTGATADTPGPGQSPAP